MKTTKPTKSTICHMTSVHGAEDIRIFHKQCVSLAANEYDVHLIARGTIKNAKGVKHHCLRNGSRGGRIHRMIFRGWETYRLAKKTNAELFHFHDPELLPYGLLLKWQGKKVVYDAHEDLPRDIMVKQWIPYPFRHCIAWITEKIENFISRRLDAVIAATPFIGQRFQTIGANATDIKNYPLMNETPYENLTETTQSNKATICYVGLISIERGILTMIQAIETLNVRLIIAGKFIDQHTDKIVRKLPGWNKIDFRGSVSHEQVAAIFAESNIGLCLFHPSPTHTESMPNKLFEYMSAGLPVLASNFPSWQPIIEQENCGLSVNPLSSAEITAGIQYLLDHPEESTLMGQKGYAATRTKYRWEAEAKRLITAYEEILNTN